MLAPKLNKHFTERFSDSHVAAICDIDGVLADNQHRLHLIPQVGLPPKQRDALWFKYNQAAKDDPFYQHVYNMFCWLAGRYSTVRRIVFTGRPESQRSNIIAWFDKYNIDVDELYCRANNDYRPNDIIKLDMLNDLRSQGLKPVFSFEDDAKSVNMLREQKVYTYCWLYGKLLDQG